VIDLRLVAANGLWILGLAVVLAGLSWAYWIAGTAGVRFRTALRRRPTQRVLDLGLALFCAGLAATARTGWERALWAMLAVAWLLQVWLVGRGVRSR